MLHACKIHIISKRDKDLLDTYIFKYKHFENLLIIILKENPDDFDLLSDYRILRAVLRNNEGGVCVDKVNYIKNKFKDNVHLNELIRLSEDLKIHNLCALIKRLRGSYKSFFTKIKKGDKSANAPYAKKLKFVKGYSIRLDQNSWSVKKKDKIGINLSDKMFYLHFEHQYLLKLVGHLDNIQTIYIVFNNKELYLSISYHKVSAPSVEEIEKIASIDLGVNNLITLFIDDKESKSVIYSGEKEIAYNTKFNRHIGKLQTSISNEVREYIEIKGRKYPNKYTKRGYELKEYYNCLHEKRNEHYYNEFHKVSKRFVELLQLRKVTKLIISYNLAALKYNGESKLGKATQKFIQIPFIKLLNYIELKCNEVGIVVEKVNEAYTSKCSCITDDPNHPKDNELNGVPSKRGLMKDKLLNKIWNCDINGAVNHIRKYNNKCFKWLKDYMFKLCNPVKIRNDYAFCSYLKAAQFP